MANTNAPNGLKPVRHLMGGLIREESFPFASGLSSALYSGDIVKLLTTGLIDKAAAGDTNLIGVFAGCQYIAADGSVVYSPIWVASTTTSGAVNATALVFSDPNLVFEVQCTTGTAYTIDMNGANADFTYAAGNASTGRSASSLNVSSVGTGTANFRIIKLVDRPDNALGDSARVEVKFNEHLYFSTTGI